MKWRFTLAGTSLATAVFLFVCVTLSYAIDITLRWDPNSESDVAGYRLWYRVGSSGPPYDGTGAYEGPSPIDVGNVTDFTVHNLDEDEDYFFAVTAYDVEENQSYYSNEVSTEYQEGSSSGSTGVAVTGSSSGGGGCFINTAGN